MLITNQTINHLNSMADDTGSKHDACWGLDLVKCSETIDTVIISGHYHIQPGETNTLYKQYKKHPASLHHLSLDQFFDHMHNRGGNATVPHYVGGSKKPTCVSSY